MRRFAAGMVTSGGLIAAMAFFLPWVGLSCSGEVLTTVSPHDRAVGFSTVSKDMLDDPRAKNVAGTDSVPAEPVYWLLLVIPGILALLGLAGLLSEGNASTQLIAGGLSGGILGIVITVMRGLRDKLELVLEHQLGPDIELQTTTEMGVWIAIAGYSLAIAGALIALVDRMTAESAANNAHTDS